MRGLSPRMWTRYGERVVPLVVAAGLTVSVLPAAATPADTDGTRDAGWSGMAFGGVVGGADIVVPEGPPARVSARDVAPGLQTVALLPALTRTSSSTWASLPADPGGPVYAEALDTAPFDLVAVTWQGAGEVAAAVRTRVDGAWSSWYELPHGDDHGPDPDSVEAAGERAGTDPLIVERSDAVQVRVDAAAKPQDLRLDLVAADAAGDAPVADDVIAQNPPSAEPAAGVRPTIYSRAQWGADESLRAEPPTYGTVRGAFVHHTVNTNAYSEAEVPAILRSIYRYHVLSRGWNDIGYNFLVDRFGRIWEGRYGGVNRPVVGAHTLGYNDDAFAMSAIGTYDEATPSSAMLTAYANLFGWKFALHGVDPRYPVYYDGERWTAIAGHRDAASTACPGDLLYAKLPVIRARTLAAMGLSPSRDLDHDGRADLLTRRSDGSLWLARGLAGGGIGDPRKIDTGWGGLDPILIPGDWDGGRHDDVIGRSTTSGSLQVFPGSGAGVLGNGERIGTGWSSMNAIVGPGDWNGRGNADLIARKSSDSSLWLYPGNGSGGFGTPVLIGSRWSSVNAIVAPGDWDGDRKPDLIARDTGGRLWLYWSNGAGAIGGVTQIGNGWQGYTLVGAGDMNGDGRPDLIGRPSGSNYLYLYPGDGRGGFLARTTIGTGWGSFDRLM